MPQRAQKKRIHNDTPNSAHSNLHEEQGRCIPEEAAREERSLRCVPRGEEGDCSAGEHEGSFGHGHCWLRATVMDRWDGLRRELVGGVVGWLGMYNTYSTQSPRPRAGVKEGNARNKN